MRMPSSIPMRNRLKLAILLLFLPSVASAQNYTISPSPFLTALDNSGNIINGACIWTYLAGTTTPATTYSDNAGTTNSNPIRSDSAGRFTAFLIAGTAYKFVYESSCTPPSHGTTLRTADNISGVPSSSATVDVTGTAAETISAGFCAYLSDGSGSKTAGSWYKCDSANAYSSFQPMIGIAPSAISSGTTGTIRLAGPVTGLSSLTIGADYYIGSSGAISATIPNGQRFIARADSATSLVVGGNPRPAVQPWINDFRLSLTTATCVTTSDVTAATTLYLTPCTGTRIDLPDASGNPLRYSTAEISIAVPATTNTMYDVFVYSNAGTPTLELLAWTNDTTRATTVTRTTAGRLLKNGDPTRMYVGSFRTTGSSGQTEDSFAKRYVWNMYNRTTRLLRVLEATDSWAYNTATYRQARATATNQVDAVIGIAEVEIEVIVTAHASNSTTNSAQVSVGEDSTTTATTGTIGQWSQISSAANAISQFTAKLNKYPAVGRHFYVWLEQSPNTGTTTWYGDNGDSALLQSGIFAKIQG